MTENVRISVSNVRKRMLWSGVRMLREKRGNGKACTLKHLHFSLGNVVVVPLRLDVVQVANKLLE